MLPSPYLRRRDSPCARERGQLPGNDGRPEAEDKPIEVTIAVGRDGTCGWKVVSADGHLASASPDARSLAAVPMSRFAEFVQPAAGRPEARQERR